MQSMTYGLPTRGIQWIGRASRSSRCDIEGRDSYESVMIGSG